jgi:hypothetical protein
MAKKLVHIICSFVVKFFSQENVSALVDELLDGIHVENHKRIPPRKILGSILIFLLRAAVLRKILLSSLGLVFLRILQLPFK